MPKKAMRKTVDYSWCFKNYACDGGIAKFEKSFDRKSVNILELIPWVLENIGYSSVSWLLNTLCEEDERWGDYVFSYGVNIFYYNAHWHSFLWSFKTDYNNHTASNRIGGYPKM